MTLGEFLRMLSETSDETILWSLGLDLALIARARSAADELGQSTNGYVLSACQALLNSGSEEEWTTVMGDMRGSMEPGNPLVSRAIERQLRRDGF